MTRLGEPSDAPHRIAIHEDPGALIVSALRNNQFENHSRGGQGTVWGQMARYDPFGIVLLVGISVQSPSVVRTH
jgi:hypothetical protein